MAFSFCPILVACLKLLILSFGFPHLLVSLPLGKVLLYLSVCFLCFLEQLSSRSTPLKWTLEDLLKFDESLGLMVFLLLCCMFGLELFWVLFG